VFVPKPLAEEPQTTAGNIVYSEGKTPVPRLTKDGLQQLLQPLRNEFNFGEAAKPTLAQGRLNTLLSLLKPQGGMAGPALTVSACDMKACGGGLRITYHPENDPDPDHDPKVAISQLKILLAGDKSVEGDVGIGFDRSRLMGGMVKKSGKAFVTLQDVDIGEFEVLTNILKKNHIITTEDAFTLWGEMQVQRKAHPPEAPAAPAAPRPSRWS
jgi:hypothetical protein